MHSKEVSKADLVFRLAERIAKERHDGHLTIYRFGDRWKAFFGTPHLHYTDYGTVSIRRAHATMTDALSDAIRNEPDRFFALELAFGRAIQARDDNDDEPIVEALRLIQRCK